MAQCASYAAVSVSEAIALDAVAKQNKLYVANLSTPLRVSTPPVELCTPLTQDAPFVLVKPSGRFAAFLRDVEAEVLRQCVDRKKEWLRKEVDDDEVRSRFKSFFAEDGAFKLKAHGEVAVFDEDGNPAGPEEASVGRHVRCVLELTRVCFGRQEFGAIWRVEQARLARVPPCLLPEADVDPEPEAEGGEACADASGDPDELEFQ